MSHSRFVPRSSDPASTIPDTVSASEFKATCLDLMDRVARERTAIVVTKRGVPVAQLVPFDHPVSPRSWGIMRGTILAQGDLIGSDAGDWPAADESDPLPAPAAPPRRTR